MLERAYVPSKKIGDVLKNVALFIDVWIFINWNIWHLIQKCKATQLRNRIVLKFCTYDVLIWNLTKIHWQFFFKGIQSFPKIDKTTNLTLFLNRLSFLWFSIFFVYITHLYLLHKKKYIIICIIYYNFMKNEQQKKIFIVVWI